jgi:hypothetical protein
MTTHDDIWMPQPFSTMVSTDDLVARLLARRQLLMILGAQRFSAAVSADELGHAFCKLTACR